jgi:hypothetical protein
LNAFGFDWYIWRSLSIFSIIKTPKKVRQVIEMLAPFTALGKILTNFDVFRA